MGMWFLEELGTPTSTSMKVIQIKKKLFLNLNTYCLPYWVFTKTGYPVFFPFSKPALCLNLHLILEALNLFYFTDPQLKRHSPECEKHQQTSPMSPLGDI